MPLNSTHMSTLQAEASFEQRENLVEEATLFVCLDQRSELFRMDDDVETANLGEPELGFLDTCLVNLLPNPASNR